MDGSKKRLPIDLAVALILAVAAVVAYAPVTDLDFITYDDPLYVTGNAHVQNGLTAQEVVWAFTTGHGNNWNPVTWISHMLDVEMHGRDAGGHHTTSLVLHVLNTLLLFLLLRQLTGTVWRSGFAAALFALHPMNVEAVAWVSDRKGVLSATFWMLTCLAYVRWVHVRNGLWYATALALFALGLMAKPTLVTLPALLLLLDAWPLARFAGASSPERPSFLAANRAILMEKVPFFAITVAAAVVTYLVQQQTGAVRSYEEVSLLSRLANAALSYPAYIAAAVWPVDLAFFYPHPRESVAIGLAVFALAGLGIVSLVVWFLRRRFPAGFLGWFWFVGTLVPMIGLIQFGRQARADRFTYIPLIGLFILVVWGLGRLAERQPLRGRILAAAGCIVLVALGWLTREQTATWENDEALCHRALEVTDDNFVAHTLLANVLMTRSDFSGAESHYSEAIRIFPDEAMTHVNRGRARMKLGRDDEAEVDFELALERNPDDAATHTYLALSKLKQGREKEGEVHLRKAIELDPDQYLARFNMGILMLGWNRLAEAEKHLEKAVRIDPRNQNARGALERVRSMLGRR